MTETGALESPGPLDGLRVLEIGHYIAVPHWTMMLADQGAAVNKIAPLDGDPARVALPMSEHGDSLYFACHNRRKRSVAMDLRNPQARPALDALLAWADLVVTNYSVGVPEKLGFGYDHLHGVNPSAVMIHITGFGSTGSKARYLAFDGAIQAMSGFSDLTGEPGRPPMMSQFLLADHTTGVHAAYAAMAALWGRARTGEGRLVELNMLDVMTSYLSGHIPARGALGQSPTRQGTGSATRYVNMFPTLDVPIYVAPVTPGMWRAFCGLIGRPEWAASGKVPNVLKDVELTAAANEVASAWFAHQTSAEAMDKLQAAGVVSGAARTVAQIYDEAVATGSPAVAFVDLPRGGTAPVPGPAFRLGQAGGGAVPGMGADTIAVLQAVGFDADALAGLSGAGVIGTHH
ncbi:CoA transferase [Phenylobacterium sp.]|uniref:CaiB/BaiF CoA transferase family protein n=1 Tax=Phenylobacterium sp. TaxID=1871053 RepID=UPI0025EABDEB|nr:CoA transferase [Phenylobacterium sp.]